MDLQDIKKKTDLVSGIITLIVAVIVIPFIVIPKAPLLLGIAAIVVSCIGAGVIYGMRYVEKLLKKNPQQNSVE